MKRLLLLALLVAALAGAGSIDLTAAQAHQGPGCDLHWYTYPYCCDAQGNWTYVTGWRWECHGP